MALGFLTSWFLHNYNAWTSSPWGRGQSSDIFYIPREWKAWSREQHTWRNWWSLRSLGFCWSAVLPGTLCSHWQFDEHEVRLWRTELLWYFEQSPMPFRQLRHVISERQMKTSYGAIFLLIDSPCATRQGSSYDLLQKNKDKYKEAHVIPQCWELHNTWLCAQGHTGDTSVPLRGSHPSLGHQGLANKQNVWNGKGDEGSDMQTGCLGGSCQERDLRQELAWRKPHQKMWAFTQSTRLLSLTLGWEYNRLFSHISTSRWSLPSASPWAYNE